MYKTYYNDMKNNGMISFSEIQEIGTLHNLHPMYKSISIKSKKLNISK